MVSPTIQCIYLVFNLLFWVNMKIVTNEIKRIIFIFISLIYDIIPTEDLEYQTDCLEIVYELIEGCPF